MGEAAGLERCLSKKHQKSLVYKINVGARFCLSLKCILFRTVVPEHSHTERTPMHSCIEEMLIEHLPCTRHSGKTYSQRAYCPIRRSLTSPSSQRGCLASLLKGLFPLRETLVIFQRKDFLTSLPDNGLHTWQMSRVK